MTEEKWLKCSNIWELTEYLHKHGSERRLRLFSHACCQRLRHLGFEELFERGLAAVKARAEGACSVEELSDLHTRLRERLDEIEATLRDGDGMLHTNWHSCLAAAVMFAAQPMYARRELTAGVTSTMGSLAFNAQGAVANPVWERTQSRAETDRVNDAESLHQVALPERGEAARGRFVLVCLPVRNSPLFNPKLVPSPGREIREPSTPRCLRP